MAAQKSTILPILFLAFTLIGCGGIVTPAVVHAAANDFPPAQTLTCHGEATAPGGTICDSSDGAHIYQHYQWSIAIRPDGHGTFGIATETGIRQSGTYQITLKLPQTININEVHGTINLISHCTENGLATSWQGAALHGPIENIVGAKTGTFKAGDSANFSFPQIVFPQPVPLIELYLYVNNDLCASSTVSWTLNGSF